MRAQTAAINTLLSPKYLNQRVSDELITVQGQEAEITEVFRRV